MDCRLVTQIQPGFGDLAVSHAHHVDFAILERLAVASACRVDKCDRVIVVGKDAIRHGAKRSRGLLGNPAE
jgi:hypothetical protein